MLFSISIMVLSEGGFFVPKAFKEAEVRGLLSDANAGSFACYQCGKVCVARRVFCPHIGQTGGDLYPYCSDHRPERAFRLTDTLKRFLEAWLLREQERIEWERQESERREADRLRAEARWRCRELEHDLLVVPQLRRLRSRLRQQA